MLVAFAVYGAILLAMIGVAWYGWVSLPSDARVPIYFGLSYNKFVSKRIGLAIYPAAGAVILLILVFVSYLPANGNSNTSGYVVSPVIMCLLLVAQVGALRLARRASRG